MNYLRQYIPWWFWFTKFMLSFSELLRLTNNHPVSYLVLSQPYYLTMSYNIH
jgi:hypothetical protein